ncbi:AMP-binding protein [Actinoplanes hulinensis]|uniref:AMP-binding protein n=1 Tax=Actinoplanes hulinensis TaxID=1144547 RepID=A0ABS7B7D6_9ACTN|nr:AMP-binding protein [Actinoplanes hulinensis]MBW6436931.1 AMP-binding protein [Actinoplanes hulinensis]
MTEHLRLSPAQSPLWYAQQLDPASPVYNTADYVRIEGPLDVARFEAAVRQMAGEAESLHTRYGSDDAGPWQVIDPRPFPFPVRECGEDEALAWMRADVRTPVDLAEGPLFAQALFRVGPQTWLWHQRIHHIAIDGFAFSMLARRVADLYTTGEGRPFRPFATALDVAGAYFASPKHPADREFWRGYLDGMPEPAALAAPAPVADHTVRAVTRIGPERAAELKGLGVGWPELFAAATAAYLHRMTGTTEAVLGLPVMGRLGTPLLRVPAIVMNIVPLRVPVRPDQTLPALARQIAAEIKRSRPHHRYRHEQMRRDLGLVGSDRRLFGPVVNAMPFDNDLRFGAAVGTMHNISAGPVEDLALGIRDFGDGTGMSLEVDGNPARYTESGLADHLDRLLHLLAEPETPLGRSRLGPAVAPRRPVWRDRDAMPVLDRIAAQVESAPDAGAVEQGGTRYTYAELWAKAGAVAAGLARRGVEADSLVAVRMRREPDAIVAILGVLLAGAAYLPIDPDGPAGRNTDVLEDARPVLILDSAVAGSGVVHRNVPGDALAYVIYTSGSTGRPNGVEISRGALSHFVAAATHRYGFTDSDRVLQFAALHFDASVEEIFGTLSTGGTLVLREPEMHASAETFLKACAELRLTVLDLPTAFWHELVHALTTQDIRVPDSVRTVIIGGEAALPDRVAAWQKIAPNVQLFNTYGPTESTVVATSASIGR